MSFKKIFPNKNQIEIEISKLIPFGNHSFDLFKGQRLEDMRNDIINRGIYEPIIVRPVTDGKYEILNGHYRVAAAKKLKLATVPALIYYELTDDEALSYVSATNPIGLLVKYNIDIYAENYMESEGFKNNKNARIFVEGSCSMTLNQYIEHFLLTDHELYDIYNSIYDMGNPYELDEKYCEYKTIARVIVLLEDKVQDIEASIEEWENTEDTTISDMYDEKYSNLAERIAQNFTRPKSGYIEQLKKYLNLDLNLFDYGNIKNKQERAKILYYIYKLKNWDFPDYNILELLSKPSMENVDNSFLGWETTNGRLFEQIKHPVEKEIGQNFKNNIKSLSYSIVNDWGDFMNNAFVRMELLAEYDYDYNDDINLLKSILEEPFIYERNQKCTFLSSSPLEILYLRLVQHEYLGQMKDLLTVNQFQANIKYNVPSEYLNEMRKLEGRKINQEDIDSYFGIENVKKIAHLVYLKSEISRDERRKIRNSKQQVLNFLNLPYPNFQQPDIINDVTELHIICCLQIILLDKNYKDFVYTFHGFEGKKGNRTGKTSPIAALKKGTHLYDAYQLYLFYQLKNLSYVNVGKDDFVKKYGELEELCIRTLIKILKCSTCEEMQKMHNFYYDSLKNKGQKH